MKEKIKNTIIIIISLIIFVCAQVPFQNIGYLFGTLIGILPIRIIEGLVISCLIWIFKERESKKWFSYFSWGFFIIACFDLMLHLLEMYAISQLFPAF